MTVSLERDVRVTANYLEYKRYRILRFTALEYKVRNWHRIQARVLDISSVKLIEWCMGPHQCRTDVVFISVETR